MPSGSKHTSGDQPRGHVEMKEAWVSESKDSKHLQSFSVVLCTIRRCQIIWREPLCSMGSRKGWMFLFYKHLDMSSHTTYHLLSLSTVESIDSDVHVLNLLRGHTIHCSKETQTHTNNCLSRSSFIWAGIQGFPSRCFPALKHFLVKAFSWFFLASGSFWIPLLYINISIFIFIYSIIHEPISEVICTNMI